MTVSRHTDLSLSYILSTPSGKADSESLPLFIVLHGRGADSTDLADIAPELDGDSGYRFVFPDAPRPFQPYPGMSTSFGRSWFDGWPPTSSSIAASRQALLGFLGEALTRYPTPAGQLIVSGFSQGAMMSLDVGFRANQGIAGIVAMSGAIYEDDLPDLDARKDQRVLLVHGTRDEVIPINAARRTRAVLEEHGVQPEYHEFDIGHFVTPESLRVVRQFVGKVLDRQA